MMMIHLLEFMSGHLDWLEAKFHFWYTTRSINFWNLSPDHAWCLERTFAVANWFFPNYKTFSAFVQFNQPSHSRQSVITNADTAFASIRLRVITVNSCALYCFYLFYRSALLPERRKQRQQQWGREVSKSYHFGFYVLKAKFHSGRSSRKQFKYVLKSYLEQSNEITCRSSSSSSSFCAIHYVIVISHHNTNCPYYLIAVLFRAANVCGNLTELRS